MLKGTISQQLALAAFMQRAGRDMTGSGTSKPVVDDLLAVVGQPTFLFSANYSTYPHEPVFPQPTTAKGSSTVQQNSLPVHPETSFLESVRTAVCGSIISPIKATSFCLAFVGLGFPQTAVSARLTKMSLTYEKNGNLLVDTKSMRENLDLFVKSLVQMKEIVDFVVAVITALNKKSVYWRDLLNGNSPIYIETPLSTKVLKSVRRCLTTMGFSDGNELMSVPSTLASLSASELLENIWTVVSKYDWESAPQKPTPQKPAPQKQAKRGRKEKQHDDAPPAKRERLSNEQLIESVLAQIMKPLLSGVSPVSLHEIFQSAFLDLSQDRLHQVMEFLSNPDNLWCLHRILMEMKNLIVSFEGDDVLLSLGDGFNFSEFNPQQTTVMFNRFFLEAIMMHKITRVQKRERIERFITALWNFWNNNDSTAFFKELIVVCPEFNSLKTNRGLLEVVLGEFMMHIYNATTRTYHNREQCEDPLQVFHEYAITRGVFSPIAPSNKSIRVCEYTASGCPFGSTCSGAHQDFVSSGWRRKGSVWGICCKEYAERRTCLNPHCRYAHFTGDEFYRALKNGGKDSKRMRDKILAQSYIAEIEKTI